MALTDITFDSNNSVVAARGNVGVLVDILSNRMMGARVLSVPAVGSVAAGIQYGQDGNALTGTSVLPAVSDVRTGVQYGANGNAYTGTYDGGGGGGGGGLYIRGR